MLSCCYLHFVKSVPIRSFSGPYFPVFGLNAERYGVSLRIQSKCGKMRTRKTPNTDTFHAVWIELGIFRVNNRRLLNYAVWINFMKNVSRKVPRRLLWKPVVFCDTGHDKFTRKKLCWKRNWIWFCFSKYKF